MIDPTPDAAESPADAQPTEITNEYGPYFGTTTVHGVTFDGRRVWAATGARLVAFDPTDGEPVHARHRPAQRRCARAAEGATRLRSQRDRVRRCRPLLLRRRAERQGALRSDRELHWRFTTGPEEWIGTDASYVSYRDGEYAIVRFAHRNWREAAEFTEHCSTKWATFLLSLRGLAESRRRRPAPEDLWIGNRH